MAVLPYLRERLTCFKTINGKSAGADKYVADETPDKIRIAANLLLSVITGKSIKWAIFLLIKFNFVLPNSYKICNLLG